VLAYDASQRSSSAGVVAFTSHGTLKAGRLLPPLVGLRVTQSTVAAATAAPLVRPEHQCKQRAADEIESELC
jgi:hypothetical protein